MKFSAVAAAAIVATGASAQLIPTSGGSGGLLPLLNSFSAFLSADCRSTISQLTASNSSVARCLNFPAIVPILTNPNTSIIPNIDAYLRSTCALPACTPAVLNNATEILADACRSDLDTIGINSDYINYFSEYYATGRKVACLSTNSTTLLPNVTSTGNLTFVTNSSTSVLCETSLLTRLQTYLGSPLTNQYIITTILGGNATAYRQLVAIPRNATLIRSLACNDCVRGSIDIVLEDYPVLENRTIVNLATSSLNNYTGLGVPGNRTQWTLPQLYQGVCEVPVGANVSLPASLNQTAFNTTLSAPLNSTSTSIRSGTPAATSSVASLRSSAASAISSIASVVSSSAAVPVPTSSVASIISSVLSQPSAAAPARRWARWD